MRTRKTIWKLTVNKRTHEVLETIIKGKKQYYYHMKAGSKIIIPTETYKSKRAVYAAIISVACGYNGDKSIAESFKATYSK